MSKMFVLVLFFYLSGTNALFHSGHKYLTEVFQESTKLLDLTHIETKSITQPVDHFNVNDNRVWEMRYFQNMEKWKPGNPIYIYIGGEGEMHPYFLADGLTYELADETNGALFATEHRYYGNSLPFNAINRNNIKYLEVAQVLRDIINLIKHIKQTPSFKTSKVVVVGGSYAGNLAAWLRSHFPDVVDAAVSSSAPVLAKLNFFEYYETVSDDFKKYAEPECFALLSKTFNETIELLKTKAGTEKFKKIMNVCEEIDMNGKLNQETYFGSALVSIAITAQYGSPSKIQHYCNAGADTYKVTEGGNCRIYNFEYYFNPESTWQNVHIWTYQTCSAFGYFMTSSKNPPFEGVVLDVEFYVKICSALFGDNFNRKSIEANVGLTNYIYGGLTPNVTNVIFVHGEIDPWHKLGITKDLSASAPARVIPGASHCNDLWPDSYRWMTEAIRKTKKEEKKLIKKWIGL